MICLVLWCLILCLPVLPDSVSVCTRQYSYLSQSLRCGLMGSCGVLWCVGPRSTISPSLQSPALKGHPLSRLSTLARYGGATAAAQDRLGPGHSTNLVVQGRWGLGQAHWCYWESTKTGVLSSITSNLEWNCKNGTHSTFMSPEKITGACCLSSSCFRISKWVPLTSSLGTFQTVVFVLDVRVTESVWEVF